MAASQQSWLTTWKFGRWHTVAPKAFRPESIFFGKRPGADFADIINRQPLRLRDQRIKTYMEENWIRYEINVLNPRKDDQRPQSLHWR